MPNAGRWIACLVLSAATVCPARGQENRSFAGKSDPPSEKVQTESAEAVREIYKSEFAAAKQPPQKIALAKKLLDSGQGTKDDDAGKYALLKEAAVLATAAGDPALAFQAVDAMDRFFRINAAAVKVKMLSGLAKEAKGKAGLGFLTDRAVECAGQLGRSGQWEEADDAAKVAAQIAKKSGDQNLIRLTADVAKQTLRALESQPELAAAKTKLADSPTDAAANGTVGRFQCLYLDDWKEGLTLLALSDDAALQKIAALELEKSFLPSVEAGDQWLALAKSRKDADEKRAFQRRAVWHYERGLAGVEGLARRKVEKSVLEFRNAFPEQLWRDEQTSAKDLPALWSPGGANFGRFAVHQGQTGVWRCHPDSHERPFIWTRQVYLPEKPASALILQTTTNGQDRADFVLKIRVNNKIAFDKVISGKEWQNVAVDLSPYAGGDTKLEIIASTGGADNWWYEYCFLSQVRIVPKP